MPVLAIVHGGIVTALYSPPDGVTPADAGILSADDLAAAVAVEPGAHVAVGMAWPPALPPPPTLAEQAQTALGAGLTITSTATPALNGLYSVDSASTGLIQGEMIVILAVGTFADGGSTVVWLDLTGTPHTFTVAQFRAFAVAIARYIAALGKAIVGQVATLPPATATIP